MRCNIPFLLTVIKLNLKSLEYRRLEFDLILGCEICYEFVIYLWKALFHRKFLSCFLLILTQI